MVSMKTSYRKRDTAYGSVMLRLRAKIGLTRVELAKRLCVSRQAVGEWEAGTSYPNAEHLKQLITLGVQSQAFAKGYEGGEIRALWSIAHQKVLLDERWLSALLSHAHPPHLHLVPNLPIVGWEPEENTIAGTERGSSPPVMAELPPVPRAPAASPRVDWNDALAEPNLYGREQEQAMLTQWVIQERCQVVRVLGIGGIGKSALSISLMYSLAKHFEVVIFRSLRD